MKKMNLLIIAMLMLMVFQGLKIYGQNTHDETPMKVFGMGLHMEQIKMSDLNYSYLMANNRIIFTFNTKNIFRVEPEFGFHNYTDEKTDLNDKGLNLGIGLFGMYQRTKANIYGGFRFEYARYSSQYKTSSVTETEEGNGILFGPAVGVEYFFSPNFSFGGELGVRYATFKSKNDQFNNDSEETNLLTQTGLILRFYL